MSMLEDINKELDALKTIEAAVEMAISLEDQGCEFYTEKAGTTTEVAIKEMFEYLADEEIKHAEYLHNFLKENNMEITVSETPSFTQALSEEFSTGKMDEVGILLAALRFERKSEDFYAELAKRSDDEVQKKFFKKLAEVERGHYEIIDGLLDISTGFRMQT
ncbi:rubrerythrin [Methanohalophilus levihalophilus]|uniref:ferritin family protein n=1 Tax=Methanohalophilus levihalophilus TaxID=1431282 RepID=UPI001AE58384|nr:ferritin family protein [Methanohalophilus levihalophilus]MBP2031133.1 rubrerythrin [Methanohalophilus levihalophilus]